MGVEDPNSGPRTDTTNTFLTNPHPKARFFMVIFVVVHGGRSMRRLAHICTDPGNTQSSGRKRDWDIASKTCTPAPLRSPAWM